MYLGIDIGGTKTLIAAFTHRGRVIRKYKFKTAQNKDKFLLDLNRNSQMFLKYHFQSVVVAIPGSVQKNCSVSLGNRDWGTFSLLKPLKELFNCPIYFENDANLATIYESHRLRGRTIFLTFSTGIGGGIADNGLLSDKSRKFEPGHIIYEYNGVKAEWEDIASAKAIGEAYNRTATDLREAEALQDVAKRVWLGIPDVIHRYSPNNIILGGPLGKIFKLYVGYLPKIPKVKYRRPKRPLESVIYGCFLYAKEMEKDE